MSKPSFNMPGGCLDGVAAFQKSMVDDADLRAAVLAFFGAEPQAKAHLLECSAPPWQGIVIRSEEEKALACIKANEARVRKLFPDLAAVTGAALARLHHTHGCDPETVQAILGVDLSVSVKEEYAQLWEQHRTVPKSRKDT